MNQDVWVVIPVFNEVRVIRRVVESLTRKFPNVVCVNDGSSDGTETEIKKTKARIVSHAINLGQGAALQTGIEYALQDVRAKYFVTFDADGQHRPEDAVRMLNTLKRAKLDIALGSRFLGKAKDISHLKKVVLKLAIKFTNKTSGLSLTDAHNGLRVFTRDVAKNLNIQNPDFSHASEIIEIIAEKKFVYREVPVTIVYNKYATTKGQSTFNAINMGLDILFDRLIK